MGIWSRKSLKSLEHRKENPFDLLPVLGPWQLIMLGIGAIIGAGLFSITGVAAGQNAGPAIIISFLIAALGCGFAGLCYSELASMIPVAGSAYTYSYATLGELIAWIIGWDLVLEYAIGAATVSISWSAYVVSLLHDFNIYLPVELAASPWQPVRLPDGQLYHGWINLPAVFIVCFVSFILIRGIKESAFINAIMVLTKLAVIFTFIVIGFFYIQPENYRPFIPENTGVFGEFGWSGILRASGVVFFAYIGFDAVSTAAQETINPQKTVPIGILGSLVVCTVLYILFSTVLVGMVNYKELDVAAPVAVAIDKTPYWWLNWMVKLAILAGLTSVMLVILLGQSRIFYSMARDGLLPPVFSQIHSRFRTPWRCNLILMVFVSLFGAFAPIDWVGSLTSIGTLLAFVLVCLGVLILRSIEPERPRPFKVPFVPWVPLAGIVVCLTMMLSLGLDNWMRLAAWLGIGFVIYVFYGRKHSTLAQDK